MTMELTAEKQAGLCLHITSLPGEYGIGEIGDRALRFILNLEALGFSVWQFLPTGPTGYGDSPYQLQSSFAGNPLLMDVGSLVQDGWLLTDEIECLRELPQDEVDYARLIPLKNELLLQAAERFRSGAPAVEQAAFKDFLEQHDANWLHDYALYRVLKERNGERPWFEWEDSYSRRDPEAIAAIAAAESEQINNIKVVQYLFAKQWSRLRDYARKHGVKLLGDMPFYVAHDSADAWANPELLLLDSNLKPLQVAGCPPDFYTADGQLWGNPVYDWEHHAADGYAWWVRRFSYALAQVDMVRIDHFRGFEKYWSVPAGDTTARNGVWVEGPGAALFDALREKIGPLPLLAEDLGVITDEVVALREQYDLPGMQVLQFEMANPGFSPAMIRPDSFCYTGTHDSDTLVGWFEGTPGGDNRDAAEIARTREQVLAVTGGSAATVHIDVWQLALESSAGCVIVPAQDLFGLGSEARLNTPGSTQGNWRWRVLPELLTTDLAERLREMLRATGRSGIGQTVPDAPQ